MREASSNTRLLIRAGVNIAACLGLSLSGACTSLLPQPIESPVFMSLDRAPAAPNYVRPQAAPSAPTVLVEPPRAAPGFDSQRIIYLRQEHRLEYFSRHQWIDTPARMVAPLMVAALEQSGAFQSVLLAPASAAGDLRLETEDLRLQQEFISRPSRVRFSLRALLLDNRSRRVLAEREFEAVVAATSDDPYGGVIAANRAVTSVLQELAAFAARAADAHSLASALPLARP